ncbi:MAG: hypothetical protein ACREP8_02980 [Candidatus Binatia bacterium]
MDAGEEKIEDEALRAALRGQARKVHFMSALTAALLTGLCMAPAP